jgi:hypothetical protein
MHLTASPFYNPPYTCQNLHRAQRNANAHTTAYFYNTTTLQSTYCKLWQHDMTQAMPFVITSHSTNRSVSTGYDPRYT